MILPVVAMLIEMVVSVSIVMDLQRMGMLLVEENFPKKLFMFSRCFL